jgi:hypothetical protein
MSVPARLDYAGAVFAGPDTVGANVNVCDLSAARFIFRDYKTFARYNAVEVPIEPELLAVLREWREKNRSPYLMPAAGKVGPMTRDEFSKYVKDVFEGTTMRVIRAIWVTEHKEDSEADQREMARRMMHSFEVHRSYYVKLNAPATVVAGE